VLGEGGRQRIAVELGVVARAGNGSHIDQLTHPGALEQVDQLLRGARGVADREDDRGSPGTLLPVRDR
jgi:hypothetical protein